MQNFEEIFSAMNKLDPEIQSLLSDSIARIGQLSTPELSRAVIVLAAIATARSYDGMPTDGDTPAQWQEFIICLSALLISVAGHQQPNLIPEPHEVRH